MTQSAGLAIGETKTVDAAGGLIDLARYPIDRLDSQEAQAFIANCKKAYDETGVCLVKGFLTAPAVEAMREEAADVAPQAFYCRKEHTVYLSPADKGQAPGDPAQQAPVPRHAHHAEHEDHDPGELDHQLHRMLGAGVDLVGHGLHLVGLVG